MLLKRVFISATSKRFISIFSAWAMIGFLHASSRYADIIRYELNVSFTMSQFVYYVASYSLWTIITIALVKCLNFMQYPFSYRLLSLCCFGFMCVWLPLYFIADFAISTVIAGEGFSYYIAQLQSISGSIIFFYTILYLFTFAVCLGIVLAQNITKAQQVNSLLIKQKADADVLLARQKMQLMQSQLSPHFLFNCLGAISGLARTADKSTLVKAIAKMGSLLRFTINNVSEDWIKLEDEIGFCHDYLELQKLRYSTRFIYQETIHTGIEDTLIPPFTIQPLLENVFRHVVDTQNETVEIHLTIKPARNMIVIMLSNSVFTQYSQVEKSGTGLNNLRIRLSHLYGSDNPIEIASDASRFLVTVKLPEKDKNHAV